MTKRAGSIDDWEDVEEGEAPCAYMAGNRPTFDEVVKHEEAKQRHEYASNI